MANGKNTSKSTSSTKGGTKSQSKVGTASSKTAKSQSQSGGAAEQVVHAIKKADKGTKKALVAIIIILLLILAVCVVMYFTVDSVSDSVNELLDGFLHPNDPALSGGDTGGGTGGGQIVGDGEFSIHFMELGNNYTGDSTYIKAGDVDILIDAGSRQSSAGTIEQYVDNYCTDGKLEYVIATHAHQDHIAGFVGTTKVPGIFEYYECETIIDFPLTNATSGIYNNYVSKRDAEVANGATHYTALQCYNGTDGAQRVYQLTPDVQMIFLYNYFYDHKTGDENDYSVCVLFKHGDRNFLLTGDLEGDGEEHLVEYNTLPQVELFKAGHHGSYTANTEALLSVIRPKVVCVCCCAGAVEYTQNQDNTFPSQQFVNNVAPYTDKVYVTTFGTVEYNETKGKYEDVGFASMNGNITVLSDVAGVTVTGSNNSTVLKDTEWFTLHRDMPDAWKSPPQ